MSESMRPSRRNFLKTTAVTATALSGVRGARAEEPKAFPALPMRKLGRSGIPVSVLNQGTAFRLTQRMLDFSYAQGTRYFDTADCYEGGGAEREIARWFERTGKRKEIFLVTKCHPTEGPRQMLEMVDARLEALKTNHIDLLFMHQLCDREYPKGAEAWSKSAEYKETAEQLKKSGKCRLVGFSIHHQLRATALENAAAGGAVDAIMFKYDPRTKKNDEMNRAIDRCVKAGIGLIAMKTQSSARAFQSRWEKMKTDDITVQQAVVKAVLSDERLSGMTSHMVSFKMIEDNAAMARDAKPLAAADRELLEGLYASGPHRLCERCGGACADAVGRPTALHDVARFVMYHEVYGQRVRAREHYHGLPAEWVDLSAEELSRAQAACADGLDYPAIFAKARRYFA